MCSSAAQLAAHVLFTVEDGADGLVLGVKYCLANGRGQGLVPGPAGQNLQLP
jgi:hypothetical protein